MYSRNVSSGTCTALTLQEPNLKFRARPGRTVSSTKSSRFSCIDQNRFGTMGVEVNLELSFRSQIARTKQKPYYSYLWFMSQACSPSSISSLTCPQQETQVYCTYKQSLHVTTTTAADEDIPKSPKAMGQWSMQRHARPDHQTLCFQRLWTSSLGEKTDRTDVNQTPILM